MTDMEFRQREVERHELPPWPTAAIPDEFTADAVRAAHARSREASVFGLGLVGLFLVSATIFGALLVTVPAFLPGWNAVAITSDSMAPSIRAGSIVVASPSDGVGLGPGTVVVFKDSYGSGLTTHRIIGVNDDGTYRTAGDANSQPDSTPLRPDHVIGVGRALVPLLGLPLAWYSEGAWVRLAIWLGVIGVALWATKYGLLVKYDPWRTHEAKADVAD